jgi:hypothetical protein
MVPQQRTANYCVTLYDNVCETKTCSYTVCVPKCVTKQIQVKVCRTVCEEVPCDPCSGCSNAGDACGCGNGSNGGNAKGHKGCGLLRCRKGC